MWLQVRRMGDPYHQSAAPAPNDLLFPTETGTPYRIGNYLKRTLKPIAAKAGIPDITYQALRRTFATHSGDTALRRTQAQLRHTRSSK
jgi:integrase